MLGRSLYVVMLRRRSFHGELVPLRRVSARSRARKDVKDDAAGKRGEPFRHAEQVAEQLVGVAARHGVLLPFASVCAGLLIGIPLGAWAWYTYASPSAPRAQPRKVVPKQSTAVEAPAEQHAAQHVATASSSPLLANDPVPTFKRVSDAFLSTVDGRTRVPVAVLEHLVHSSGEAAPASATREHMKFAEEPGMPTHLRAHLRSYASSGFDRGHMAPAADMRSSPDAMRDSFYLSNIAPQVGVGMNRDVWARLEAWVRDLGATWSDVWVVTGPVFAPSRTTSTGDGAWAVQHGVIGEPLEWISVPTHFYKAVLVRGPRNPKLPPLAVAAFMMPNEPLPADTSLAEWEVPLVALEALTGITPFRQLLSDQALCATACTRDAQTDSIPAGNLARILACDPPRVHASLRRVCSDMSAAVAMDARAADATDELPGDKEPSKTTGHRQRQRVSAIAAQAIPSLCAAVPCVLPTAHWFSKPHADQS